MGKVQIRDMVSVKGDQKKVFSVDPFLRIIPDLHKSIVTQQRQEISRLTEEKERLKKELDQANKNLEKFTMRDHLTSLYNRRFVDEVIKSLIADEKRARRSWGVIMADIDYFKSINDKYGHPFGDQVLSNVAKMLSEVSRKGDFVVRYGGEEFIIFIRDLNEEKVEALAERYRTSISAVQTMYQESERVSVTISIGVCFVPSDSSMDVDQVIKYADVELYRAKENGRNCVSFHDRRKDRLGNNARRINDRRSDLGESQFYEVNDRRKK